MEYGTTVWDPYQKYISEKVVRVQRRAARFVKGRYSTYSSVSDVLGWPPLSQRRQEARLILFYKMINSLAEVPFEGILVQTYKGTRRKHNMKFRQIGHTTSQYGQSFFPKTITAYHRPSIHTTQNSEWSRYTLINNTKHITIANIYIHPRDSTSPHYKTADTDIQHCIQHITNIPHSVLPGDVNAHSTLWYSYTDDHRGQLIADVISNSDHITLNTNTPTRVQTPHYNKHLHQISPRCLTHYIIGHCGQLNTHYHQTTYPCCCCCRPTAPACSCGGVRQPNYFRAALPGVSST